MDPFLVLLGVGMITSVVMGMVVLLLIARKSLVPSGEISIVINKDESK